MRSVGLTMRTRVRDRQHTRTRYWFVIPNYCIKALSIDAPSSPPPSTSSLKAAVPYRLSRPALDLPHQGDSPVYRSSEAQIPLSTAAEWPLQFIDEKVHYCRILNSREAIHSGDCKHSAKFVAGVGRHRQPTSSYVCGFTLFLLVLHFQDPRRWCLPLSPSLVPWVDHALAHSGHQKRLPSFRYVSQYPCYLHLHRPFPVVSRLTIARESIGAAFFPSGSHCTIRE